MAGGEPLHSLSTSLAWVVLLPVLAMRFLQEIEDSYIDPARPVDLSDTL